MANVINKITFDFTCASEEKARETQQEISNYVIPKMNERLSYFFEKQSLEKENIILKTVEIDLGDILIGEFRENETLDKITEALEKKLAKNYQHNDRKIETNEASEFEIITTFLQTGDLPWWLDKTVVIELDLMLKNQVENNIEALKTFFQTNKSNISVRQRFLENSSPITQNLWKKNGFDFTKNVLPKNTFLEEQELIKNITHHAHFFQYNLFEFLHEVNLEKILHIIDYDEIKLINLPVYAWIKKVKKMILKEQNLINFMAKKFTEKALNIYHILPLNNDTNEIILSDNITLKNTNQKPSFFTEYEGEIVAKVLKNKKFATENEREIIDKFLNTLSKESLVMIHFFTQIQEEEILFLLSQKENFQIQKSIEQKVLITEIKEKLLVQIKNQMAENEPQLESIFQKKEGFEFPFENSKNERKIIVENAGLCVLSAYFLGLWKNLNYLEQHHFKSIEYAQNGVHLLQYLATGKRNSPEYLLQFNKLLCGLEVDDFLGFEHTISAEDFGEADNLLESIIGNWKALKNTSVDGLRTSFLQRKGILTEKEKYWVLQVERKGFDLLLHSLPWSFSMIKTPWMKKNIQVEW